MMRHVARGAALLLVLALALLSLALAESRFLFAAVAIFCLVETGLALRARRGRAQAPQDRSRFTAARVSCSEKDGVLSVALFGDGGQPPQAAPYVLLSRRLPTPGAGLHEQRPYLELSGSKWSLHGGIRDAFLSPRLLRLTLDARGAEALGVTQVCVTLQGACDLRRLERTLGKILRGIAFTSERSLPGEPADMQSPVT